MARSISSIWATIESGQLIGLRGSRGLRIHVYSICWNERRMIEYFLRHYETFAERIVIYDDDSDDGTKEILLAHNKVEVRRFVRSDHNSLELSRTAIFDHC